MAAQKCFYNDLSTAKLLQHAKKARKVHQDIDFSQPSSPRPARALHSPSRSRKRRTSRSAGAAEMDKGIRFVIAGPDGQVDKPTRKSVRRYVMLGKNKGKGASKTKKNSQPPEQPHGRLQPGRTRAAMRQPARSGKEDEDDDDDVLQAIAVPDFPKGSNRQQQQRVARMVSSPLSLFPYAETMQPYTLDLVHKYFNGIKKAMYPSAWCLDRTADPVAPLWFDYLATDPVYLNAALFACAHVVHHCAGDDEVASSDGGVPTPVARSSLHLGRTLRLLRERVGGEVTEPMVGAVVTMLLMAAGGGDVEAVRVHAGGVRRMLDLRGGGPCLVGNLPLRYIVALGELVASAMSGRPVVLGSEHFLWGTTAPVWPDEVEKVRQQRLGCGSVRRFVGSMGADVAEALDWLVVLVRTGEKMERGAQICPDVFKELMISVLYRVSSLRRASEMEEEDEGATGFAATRVTSSKDTWREAIRLGMVAFSTNTFIQPEAVRIQYRTAKRQLQEAVLGLDELRTPLRLARLATREMLIVALWLVMVTVATFSFENGHDREVYELGGKLVSHLQLTSWGQCKELLAALPGVDVVHDAPGLRAFEFMTSPGLG